MKTIKMKISLSDLNRPDFGHIDTAKVDATTKETIAEQMAEDEHEAMLDAAKFARRVRKRLGLSQAELIEGALMSRSKPSATGSRRRYPTGAARQLLRS